MSQNKNKSVPRPEAPARETTILELPRTYEVKLGETVYKLGEIRPADMPALMDFIAQLSSETGAESFKDIFPTKRADGTLNLEIKSLLGFGSSQPKAVCQLLAAVLDPDPINQDRVLRQAQRVDEFMTLPVSQVTNALGKWIEVNASFFARQVTPLVLGVAAVVEQVSVLIREQSSQLLKEKEPSNTGSVLS